MRRQAIFSGLALLQRAAIGHGAERQAVCALGRSMEQVFGAVRGYADDANLKKTALYDFHVAHGGERSAPLIASERLPSVQAWITVDHASACRGKLAPHNLTCRQDGPLRRLVHAHSVQGQHHRLDHALPQARVHLRRLAHVRLHAQGASAAS